ncbi:hypothetical protein EJ08DRAFT_618098 [Tothia fuscella]|uniref:Uncharacterized protein n=1 Tax=Tothia fuscella TaxID=1048955 RepID=A0A9P4NK99_9PEZI|nr:hypothetical protein EJ08DRAFT_618098 [Tothia fuscella]
MRNIPYRCCIMLVNIVFPPVAIMMLTGLGHDTLVNSLLFLAGVIPSHIHAFYLSSTYFHRRRKARKGKYPGGRASMIASTNVLNGGLSSAECESRRQAENGWVESNAPEKQRSHESKTTKRKSKRESKRNSKQTNWRDAETQIYPVQQGMVMSFARPDSQSVQTWRSDVPVGFTEDLMPALPPRPGVG